MTLQPRPIRRVSPSNLADFRPEASAFVDVVKVKAKKANFYKKKDALLCKEGFKFDIESGEKIKTKFDREIL